MTKVVTLDELSSLNLGHSIFSPSGSAIWINCPGALIPNVLAEDSAGEDAAYGTVAHSVVEQWLTGKKKPKHLIGTSEFVESGDWGYLIEIDEVMMDHAQTCVDSVEFATGGRFVEYVVDFSEIMPIGNQKGTVDFASMEPGKLKLTDWKFGKGITVYAENNTQLLLYAIGLFLKFDSLLKFEEIEMNIVQPRKDHQDTWTISRSELLEWCDVIKQAAIDAWDELAPRIPGEKQCQWCKIKAVCPELAEFNINMTQGYFTDIDEPVSSISKKIREGVISKMHTPSLFGNEELSKLFLMRKHFESWWNAVENETYKRANKGENIPNLKFVETNAHRIVSDVKKCEKKLLSYGLDQKDIYVTSMITPPNIEKALLKKGYRRVQLEDMLKGIVMKPRGKPTLVSVSDKRPNLVNMSDHIFNDLTLEDDEL